MLDGLGNGKIQTSGGGHEAEVFYAQGRIDGQAERCSNHVRGESRAASTSGPTKLRLPHGQLVDPMGLSADEVDAAMGVEDLVSGTEIEIGGGNEAGSEQGLLQDLPGWLPAVLILCLFVIGGIVGVGLIWVGLFRGRGKKAVEKA